MFWSHWSAKRYPREAVVDFSVFRSVLLCMGMYGVYCICHVFPRIGWGLVSHQLRAFVARGAERMHEGRFCQASEAAEVVKGAKGIQKKGGVCAQSTRGSGSRGQWDDRTRQICP